LENNDENKKRGKKVEFVPSQVNDHAREEVSKLRGKRNRT